MSAPKDNTPSGNKKSCSICLNFTQDDSLTTLRLSLFEKGFIDQLPFHLQNLDVLFICDCCVLELATSPEIINDI